MAEKQNMVSRRAQPFTRGWCAQHGLAPLETDHLGRAPISPTGTTCLFQLYLFFFFFPPAFQYKCLVEGCAEKFKSSKDRKDHLVTVHLYPADFRFDRPKKLKSGPKHVSSPTKQGASMPMDVSVEMSEQFQVDPMEIGPSENTEIPQPAASPSSSVPEKRLYKSRIPSTICFGQGATRGFKGPRKKV
uniref:C2H2-type domain-containing protein n=1 Tax=Buteo japonicus TaxID=224669 RepID=A0A8C0HQA3_9AVES